MKRQAEQSVGDLQGRGVVLLTKTQMAVALQVCPRTIDRMMARGEISYFKIGGRLVRFHIEEVLRRMRERALVAAEGEKGQEAQPRMDTDAHGSLPQKSAKGAEAERRELRELAPKRK